MRYFHTSRIIRLTPILVANAYPWESGCCNGYSPRLAQMGPGFNSRYGLYVQMVSQSIFALAGFLRDLPFPPAFEIGSRVFITSKHPFTLGYWGCYNLSADMIAEPYGLPVAARLQRFESFRRKALY